MNTSNIVQATLGAMAIVFVVGAISPSTGFAAPGGRGGSSSAGGHAGPSGASAGTGGTTGGAGAPDSGKGDQGSEIVEAASPVVGNPRRPVPQPIVLLDDVYTGRCSSEHAALGRFPSGRDCPLRP